MQKKEARHECLNEELTDRLPTQPAVVLAGSDIELTEETSENSSHCLIPHEPIKPTEPTEPRPAAPTVPADIFPDPAMPFSFFDHTWPVTRLNQIFNIFYFGTCAVLLIKNSIELNTIAASLGAAVCFVMAATSVACVVRYRDDISIDGELPSWLQKSLRNFAIITPMALILGQSFYLNSVTRVPEPKLVKSNSSGAAFTAARVGRYNATSEIEIADRLYRKENYVDAADHYHNAVVADPKNEHSYIYLADIYSRYYESYDLSKGYADQALAVNPHSAVAGSLKAAALNHLGSYTEALQVANAAIADDANQGEAYNAVAIAQRHLGHFKEALAADNQHVKLHPNETQSYASRAATFEALGRASEAKADIEKVERLAGIRK